MAKRMIPNKKAIDAVAKQTPPTPKPISEIMPGKRLVKKPVQQKVVSQPAVQPAQQKPVAVKPQPAVQEPPNTEVKPEPVQTAGEMVFQPISKKKNTSTTTGSSVYQDTKATAPVLQAGRKSANDREYDLDTIINTIVDGMMDKFVTREEVQTLIESTIKKMIIENSIKSK